MYNQERIPNLWRRVLVRAAIAGLMAIFLIGIGAAAMPAQAATPEEAFQRWIQTKTKYRTKSVWTIYNKAGADAAANLKAGNYARAEALYRELLENPNYPMDARAIFVEQGLQRDWDQTISWLETDHSFMLAISQAGQGRHAEVIRTVRFYGSRLESLFEKRYRDGTGFGASEIKDRAFFENLYAYLLTAYARALEATGEIEQAIAQYSRAGNLGSAEAVASAQQLRSRLAELSASMRQKLLGAAEADMAGRLEEALGLYAEALRDSAAVAGDGFNKDIAEKTIAIALRMSPAPAVSREARRRAYFGQALVRDAEDAGAFDEAAGEYFAAVIEAPWWADVYINLGLLQEERGKFRDAVTALRLYLMAAPAAPDAAAVRAKISELTRKARLSEAK